MLLPLPKLLLPKLLLKLLLPKQQRKRLPLPELVGRKRGIVTRRRNERKAAVANVGQATEANRYHLIWQRA